METDSIKIYFSENSKDFLLLYESGVKNPEVQPLEYSIETGRLVSGMGTQPGSISVILEASQPVIQLKENIGYKWKLHLENKSYSNMSVSSSMENGNKYNYEINTFDDSAFGNFKIINFLGTAYIQFNHIKISFDVLPVKFDHSEYRVITEEISQFCEQLLIEWLSPTSLKFSSDPAEERKIILEQFIFLRNRLSEENLQYCSEMIRRNPHRSLDSEMQFVDSAFGADEIFYSDPFKYGKDWQRKRNEGSFNILGFLPEKILSQRKYETFDTPPNRFIKYALCYFLNICNYIEERKPSVSAVIESKKIKENIEVLLSAQLFTDVGELDYIPFNNQTLLKREGYRQILEYYSMIENALYLNWEGNRDAFEGSNRGIDVLYEYWVYLKIFNILKDCGLHHFQSGKEKNQFLHISKDEMRINLKEGKETISVFLDLKRNLRVHLYYNRSFGSYTITPSSSEDFKPIKGSYSRTFRPDYTLVILPFSRELNSDSLETAASEEGKIAYLHFDAKYRLDKLEEIFSNDLDTEEDILEEKKSEKSSIYKNGDLYKMHTYNEAIRRTVGSYILYPGNKKYEYLKYHEILPGVGAFPMSPKRENTEIKNFLERVLNHQSNQFTQYYRISYFTHDTIIKKPLERLIHTYHQYSAPEVKPPTDILAMLCSVPTDILDLIKQNRFYLLNAILNGDVVAYDKSIFQCSLFIGFSENDRMQSWYARINSIVLKKRSDLKTYSSNHFLSEDVSHFYLVEFNDIIEGQQIHLPANLGDSNPTVKRFSDLFIQSTIQM